MMSVLEPMAVYTLSLYESRPSIGSVKISRDDGSVGEFMVGSAYDVSPTEADKLRRWVMLTPGGTLASAGSGTSLETLLSRVATLETSPFTQVLSEGSTQVGLASTLVIPANAARRVLVLSNGSDTGIWFKHAALGAAPNQGTYLPPNGMPFAEPYNGAVSAVHIGTTGTKTLGWVEY